MTGWQVEFLNDIAVAEFRAFPADIRARIMRVINLIERQGLPFVTMPHVRHVTGKLWEIRAKGKDGIARSLYVTAAHQRVVILRSFNKKTDRTPAKEVTIALERMREVEL